MRQYGSGGLLGELRELLTDGDELIKLTSRLMQHEHHGQKLYAQLESLTLYLKTNADDKIQIIWRRWIHVIRGTRQSTASCKLCTKPSSVKLGGGTSAREVSLTGSSWTMLGAANSKPKVAIVSQLSGDH